MKDGDDIYIWEVKPYSYAFQPKRSIALAQLAGYISADPSFKPGSTQITGGTTTLNTVVSTPIGLEYVTYEIKYEVELDGLIFYSFKRHSKPVENPDTVTVTERDTYPVKAPSNHNAFNDYMNPDDSDSTEVDWGKVIAYVTVAKMWSAANQKVNSNPSTTNSLSTAIITACNAFLIAVGSDCASYMLSPETVNAAEINAAIDDFELALEVYGDEELIDEILLALENGDAEAAEEIIKELQEGSSEFDEASLTQPSSDPLVIDLGTKGIELTTIDNGVNFDLDNNGFAEQTAWVGTEDGFLVYDRNGNGVIDNGGELFGDKVVLSDGLVSSNGFEALSEYDINGDYLIDCNDDVFSNLSVWIDANHNGISEAEEIISLTDTGIVSISLMHRKIGYEDEVTGTLIMDTADVMLNVDGVTTTVEISEFWFPINSTRTTKNGIATVGNIPDLEQAIWEDETGKLWEFVRLFGETNDIGMKRYYTREVLYFITGAADIEPDSRGGNIDARELRVIEQFMGRNFEGVDGSSPNAQAADILNDLYNEIENKYYSILSLHCGLGGYMNVVYEYEDSDGNKILNLGFINYIFTSKIKNGDDVYYGTDSADFFYASDGNDTLYGNAGNDYFYGDEGIDTFWAGSGNDVMDGGTTYDWMFGDVGNDTYILYKGCRNDYIKDGSGSNVIRFTDDTKPEDIKVSRSGNYDVKMQLGENGDIITIQEFAYASCYGEFTLEFSDGTVMHVRDAGSPFHTLYGTTNKETISAMYSDTTIYAEDGDDVLYSVGGDSVFYCGKGNDGVYGGGGNDTFYGDEGIDTFWAGSGNDVMDGGMTYDWMFGDGGNDTYILYKGCGNDYIKDGSGSNVIRFTDDTKPEDIKVSRSGNYDVKMQLGENGDIITIQEFAYASCYGEYTLEFSDGTVIHVRDVDSPFNSLF